MPLSQRRITVNDKLPKPKTDLSETLRALANKLSTAYARAIGQSSEVLGEEIAEEVRKACCQEWRRFFLEAFVHDPAETRAVFRRLKHKGSLKFLEDSRAKATRKTAARGLWLASSR